VSSGIMPRRILSAAEFSKPKICGGMVHYRQR